MCELRELCECVVFLVCVFWVCILDENIFLFILMALGWVVPCLS